MIARIAYALFIAVTMTLSGCMSDGHSRRDGITAGAGDAIAANTVLQMVDPWPAGVQHTGLRVPSRRLETGNRPLQSQPSSGYGD